MGCEVGCQLHELNIDGSSPFSRSIPLRDHQFSFRRVRRKARESELAAQTDGPERFLDVLGAATEEDYADTRFRDALFADTLADNPLPLTNWSRILSMAYRHSSDLVHELEDHEGVYTFPASMMRYEVTRGQWGEFLEAVLGSPSQMRRHPFVQELWRPAPEPRESYEDRLRYARGYWLYWWGAVLNAYLARNAALPSDERPALPKRPAWLPAGATDLTDGVTGITDKQGAMLLIPPQWVRVSADGESISWNLEEDTEDLPITGISWWDVKMFIAWAVKYLGNPNLALPNWGEWQRSFHGGRPSRAPDDIDEIGIEELYPWPWGEEPRPALCNNLHYGTEDNPAALRSVRMTYPTGNGGLTLERLHNMSGNAAEWTDNYDVVPQDGKIWVNPSRPSYEWGTFLGANRVCGGSYLSGLDECRAGSSETLDKRAHRNHVGFRLIVRQHKFGD